MKHCERSVFVFGVLLAGLSLSGCGDPSDGPSDDGGGVDGRADASSSVGDGLVPGTDGPAADMARQDPVLSTDHPRIYLNDAATRARLVDALNNNRAAAMRFKSMVDSEIAGTDHYDFKPWFAALLGQLTGTSSYCAFAVERTEAWVAAEETRINAGQRADVAGDSYLEVGPIIGGVARVYDWCYTSLTPTQRTRWLAYANQAVWNVWHHETATWGGASYPWSGWSVDNPSNNYYYSFLEATMLLGLAAHGEHPDAMGWVTMFRQTKIQGELVPTFQSDLVGGGSREGTGYGVAMMRLYELYDLWEASTGERIHDLTGHARASLLHFLHTTAPTRDRIAPVGDHARDQTAALFDYHRNYLQILASLYRADPLAPFAKWFLSHSSVTQMSQYFMYVYDFMYDQPSLAESDLVGLATAYYGSGTGQVSFRSSWATDATWAHLMAGPYTESHAHHDQGSLLVYRGEWLAYDQNIQAQSGIRQEEELHNLVRLVRNGTVLRQPEGNSSELLALRNTARYGYAATNIAPMYPGNGVVKNEREVVFLRPDTVVVFDRIDTGADTTKVWQLNTPILPNMAGTTATLAGASGTLIARRVLPAGASSTVVNWTSDGEMSGGYRIDTSHTSGDGKTRFLHVLSVDGVVSTAVESSSGTLAGTTISFADGTKATVRFQNDSVGGTLELRDAADSVVEAVTLTAGVSSLPELAP